MHNNLRILHLEDEPSDALLVSLALKQADFKFDCMVVDTKEKFLTALNDFNPEFILADHSLPSFDSFEALELLGKRENKIPVILVTATMSDEFAVNAIKKGARDYVLKDRLGRLPSAIKNVLKTQRLEKEREGFLVQLQRNEHKFRRLIENGADAVAVLSPDGTPSYVTPSLKRVLGYSEKEALALNMYEIIHKYHRECVQEKLKECLNKPQTPFDGHSVRARHKDGSWRWLEVTLTSFMEDSAIEGIVADFRDVTERKFAEKAIKESEEKYRSFFENSLDGILLAAPDGKIFAANASACEMFQRTEKEICEVGRAGIADTSDPRVARAIKERNSAGKVMADINMVRKDGSIFPASLSSANFEDANGEKLTSMIIRDISESKRAEKELKTSETEYRKLFQNSPLPNIIYDKDTLNILDANQATLEHYGFTRNEILQMTILDFVPKEDIPDLKYFISNLPVEGKGMKNNSTINLKKNGERIQVETFGYGLQYKERNCRLVIFLDITEKEVALKKLKDKTEKLMSAEKLAKLGYWEVGLQEDYFYWSDEVYNIWGRKKEEFQVGPEEFEKTIHPEDLENFRKHQIMAINGIKDLDYEHRIILPNEEIKWIHEKGKLIKDKKGKPVYFEGSVQDITIIKNSELEALKASEEKEIILGSIGDAFFMADNDWTVTYWNRHSEELLECVKEKVLGKNLWDVFPDAIGTKFYTFYQKAVRERSIEDFVEYFERTNKWFEVTAYPSNNGLSVYFRDVTERKESELQIIELNNNLKAHTEELVEANKGLEQFSFIVSHNLRSPVANILGIADLLNDEGYTQEVKNNFLKALFDNVKRLDTVISDLNAILQVKVDMDAKKEPVVLDNLVDAIKTSIQNLVDKENVQLTTHFDVTAIDTVQGYLHSIFYNLITNSIKYRRPGVPPHIEISSEIKEENIVITFEDNGLGIDLGKKGEQVFGLYRRFHHHIEGKGMGLFLVKTQVELLGGKISIESDVNAGTKFTITFKKKTLNNISEYEETTLYNS